MWTKQSKADGGKFHCNWTQSVWTTITLNHSSN